MMDTPPILNNYVSRTKATGLKPVVFYAVLSLFYYIGVMEVSEKFVKENFCEELKMAGICDNTIGFYLAS
jgi:hypothetical protein